MRKTVLAALFALVLAAPALADDAALQPLSEAMQGAGNYSYTLRIRYDHITVKALSGEDFGQVQESEGNGFRKAKDGSWEASPHIAHRILPFIITRAFRAREAPEVMTMDIEGLGGGKEPQRIYSLGDAEAVYTVMHLAPPDAFNKWLAKHASPGIDIVDIPKDGSLEKTTRETSDKNGFLKVAKRRYDHLRPQLIRRFNTSYLYYPASNEVSWSLRRSEHGEKLYAVATVADLMYAAEFWLEYEGEQHDGAWVPLKAYGRETFKGE